MTPLRTPLYGFPDLVLHADELAVKRHPQYAAAKAGGADAAEHLVESFANRSRLRELVALLQGRDVRLLPVHALESEGVNEIPAALAEWPSEQLGLQSRTLWCNPIPWVTRVQAGFSGSQIRPSLPARWSAASTIFWLMISSDREGRWRTSSGTSIVRVLKPSPLPS